MSRKLAPYWLISIVILSSLIPYLLEEDVFDISSLPDEPVKNLQGRDFSDLGSFFTSGTTSSSLPSPSPSVGSTTT